MDSNTPKDLKHKNYIVELKFLLVSLVLLLLFLILTLNIRLLLAPWHADDYLCYSFSDYTIPVIFHKSRPLFYLYTWLCGQSSFEVMMIGFVLIGLLYIVFVRRGIESILSMNPIFVPSAFYLLICIFSKDFFFSFSYDIPSRLAGIFAILYMVTCHRRAARSDGGYAQNILPYLFFLASALSKETYLISMFAWGLLVSLIYGTNMKRVLANSVILIALSAVSLKWSSLSGPFVNLHASASDPYYIERNPLLILGNFWRLLWFGLGRLGLYLVVLSSFACGLLYHLDALTKRQLQLLTAIVIFGLLSYVPNSLLSNHYFPIYHLISIPFLYSTAFAAAYGFYKIQSIANIYRLSVTLILGITICSFSSHDFKKQYAWNILQVNIAENIIESLHRSQSTIQEHNQIAVLGLSRDQYEVPFHPWLIPKALNSISGCARYWEVYGNSIGTSQNVSFRKLSDFPGDSDLVIFIGPDGSIDRAWSSFDISRFRSAFPDHRLAQFLFFEPIRRRVEEIYTASPTDRHSLLRKTIDDFANFKFVKIDVTDLFNALKSADSVSQ